MEIPPQRRRHEARRAVSDRSVIDSDHGHDELAGRRQERFPRLIGLLDGKRTLLQFQALCTQRVDDHGPRDALEDAVVGLPGHHLAVARDDPGVGRGPFGDPVVLVDIPGFARALLARGLLGENVGKKRDGFDVDALPAIVREA